MPLVKIELARGKEKNYLGKLMTVVMDCVQEILRLPPDDRNIRILENDPELFTMKPPYTLLIEITMFTGRSNAIKKALYQKIVTALDKELGIDRNAVFIVINEQPLENWGVRGGVPASEIKLDFTVNI